MGTWLDLHGEARNGCAGFTMIATRLMMSILMKSAPLRRRENSNSASRMVRKLEFRRSGGRTIVIVQHSSETFTTRN
jgi:hypothetical protein